MLVLVALRRGFQNFDAKINKDHTTIFHVLASLASIDARWLVARHFFDNFGCMYRQFS
jgi:hypothetical protein